MKYSAAYLVFVLLLPAALRADVIVLSNRTDRSVLLELESASRPANLTLGSTETRAYRADGPVSLRSQQLATGYLLDPWGVYYLADDAQKNLVLGQIELPIRDDLNAGGQADVSTFRKGSQHVVIPVRIYVDEEEPTRQHVWEKRLRARVAAASEILKSHCFVELKVVDVAKWDSDDKIVEFEQSLAEFERETSPDDARLAIGFTSQFQLIRGRTHLGGIRGPLERHLLLREWSQIITEPERLEVLIHELGHFLGASHSPEANSVMRPILGDRLARAKKFRIGFDPVNTLAMCLVSEQLATSHEQRLADLAPPVQRQLQQIYVELAKTMPDDPAAKHFIALVERSRAPTVVTGARAVVVAIRRAAQQQANSPNRPKGDALAASYLQAAASAARSLPQSIQVQSLLLGAAVGLDRTDVLRGNTVAGALCRAIENDQERKARLDVLDHPTLHNREDLLQHFVVSAGLAALVGSSTAESIGLAKEQRDAGSGSGFSFADYQANLAGIRFAESLQRRSNNVDRLAQQFNVGEFVPTPAGLTEGLGSKEFSERFGSYSDERFTRQRTSLVQRIDELPAYMPKATPAQVRPKPN